MNTKRVRAAVQLYDDHGLTTLLQEIYYIIGRELISLFYYFYGHRTFSICGFPVQMEIPSSIASRELEHSYRTEHKALEFILEKSDRGNVFWDVGAHLGLYSVFAMKSGAEVIAFEPNEHNQTWLRKNLESNGHTWTIFGLALSNEAGEVQFRNQTVGSGGARIVTDTIDSDEKVLSTTGDKLLGDGTPPPDIVKVDVEGHEIEVFQGMRENVLEYCRNIVFEVHTQDNTLDEKLQKISKILKKYHIEKISNRRNLYIAKR